MSSLYRPSLLRFPKKEKTLQLRFVRDSYELTLFDGRAQACPTARFTASQIRMVTIEMQKIQQGSVCLGYDDRYIVIRADGQVWIKVPDVMFMRLHSCASTGAGENIDC